MSGQSRLLTVVRAGAASKEGISGYTHLSGSLEKGIGLPSWSRKR